MSLFKRGSTWWYEFWFAGRRIQESSRSTSKTVARTAEQKRRRELEEGYNSFEDVRQERVRTIREVGDDYLAGYKLRNPQSAIYSPSMPWATSSGWLVTKCSWMSAPRP